MKDLNFSGVVIISTAYWLLCESSLINQFTLLAS